MRETYEFGMNVTVYRYHVHRYHVHSYEFSHCSLFVNFTPVSLYSSQPQD